MTREEEDRVRLWAHLVARHKIILSPTADAASLVELHGREHDRRPSDHQPDYYPYSMAEIGRTLAEAGDGPAKPEKPPLLLPVDPRAARDLVRDLRADLKGAEEHLKKMEARCPHEWTEPTADPAGKTKWTRSCKKCWLDQSTTAYFDVTTRVPKFDPL